MNFSIPIKYTGISEYSHYNKFFCLIKNTELHIYSTTELNFIQKFSFNDQISNIEWSPDCNLILVTFLKQGVCEVKSLDSPDWICKIDEGVAGMASARWSPDSRRILTICDFNLRLTIWSLIDRSTNFINYPKFSEKGMAFTGNNYFLALVERKECKDFIGLYYIADWTLVSHFCLESVDCQDVFFTKDDGEIVVLDGCLECKFFVYSPKLWLGKPFETIVHLIFSLFWIYLTIIFGLVCL